ncbi:TatD family hydrolase [Haloarcula nitratireducens]|uniref:TatD family hydrolase n=1 Tax=Haloarcula nitratireducens TaxID=2487749 RepID=A0AAW4PDZ6_9EURY|nr:TatD family hydrolase [Halomicroarcula nitratireducens]MBX0296130.1 TatD family hydrolase [Halomicroarcula nitratireducens]
MRVIDPHMHMVSRSSGDYERARRAGIECCIEPAFWSGTDKQYAGSFFDYFEHLIDFETERAERAAGMDHYVTIGLEPKEANYPEMAETVLDRLPEFLDRENVVGVGEIGLDQGTEAEEYAFRRQLRMAEERELPVIVHTPHENKPEGTERLVEMIREEDVTEERIILDHNTENTIDTSLRTDCWIGFTLYPGKIEAESAIDLLEEYGTDKMLFNSAADWDPSDPLAVPKARDMMLDRGWDREDVQTVVFDNPYEFFDQSPNFEYER